MSEQVEQAPDMDALFQVAVDQEAVAEVKKDSQMEAGTWDRTGDPATVTINTHPVTGRKGFEVAAPVEKAGVKGFLRFRLSWQRFNKIVVDQVTGDETDTGKPDIQSRLYANVVDAYKKVNAESATISLGNLAEYLAHAPYRLRIMNGDDREIVLGLYIKK